MEGNDKVIRVCPECGFELVKIDLMAHALEHWPEYLDPAKSSKLARIRQEKLLKGGVTYDEYLKDHSEV
jgi:hypothetical protein